jgi:hypothetical protein
MQKHRRGEEVSRLAHNQKFPGSKPGDDMFFFAIARMPLPTSAVTATAVPHTTALSLH